MPSGLNLFIHEVGWQNVPHETDVRIVFLNILKVEFALELMKVVIEFEIRQRLSFKLYRDAHMVVIDCSPEPMRLPILIRTLCYISVEFNSADAMLQIRSSNNHALHSPGQPRVVRQHGLGHFAKAGELVVEEECFLLRVRLK